ncbi:MAG: glycosyl hydrolase 115 family protein, partial [Defluviitaleaceae bacterium]|nr:glycosyl hydrolase 115 family protein [Defluviitaleaceae bacterium]
MNINTKIIYKGGDPAILRAIEILRRDMAFVFLPTNEDGGEIRLNLVDIAPEGFRIEGGDIFAGDALGFVYALMRISENSLGIPPFWFWYDHKHKKIPAAEIADFISKPAKIRYRGWFINDEILLNKWSPDSDPMSPWHMAYEALLRCGGNMIIPNTQVSRPHCDLAAQYGLWLTHHHAEPLGAEMFVKIYPDLPPSYFLHEDKFKALWLDGINWQKGHNVIWNLGFRGQGDQAFWSSDTRGDFATDEARGGLISRLIRYQYDLVREHIPDGICCTYIYGEIMGLYRDGHISIPDDVIKIWADNGYGKMVVRRTGRENTRQAALPDSPGRHGIYYH